MIRFILLLVVIVAIAALIQTKRHDCKWGSDDWFSCVVNNTQKEFYSAAEPDGRLAQTDSGVLRASAM